MTSNTVTKYEVINYILIHEYNFVINSAIKIYLYVVMQSSTTETKLAKVFNPQDTTPPI